MGDTKEQDSIIKKKSFKLMVILGILLFCAFLFILIAYTLGDHGTIIYNTSLSFGEALALWGAILAFYGTAFLGLVSLWQNERYKKDNDESQAKMEKFNERANSISEKMLNIEVMQELPILDFKEMDKPKYVNIELYLMENRDIRLKIWMSNISPYLMLSVYVESIVLYTYKEKFILNNNSKNYNDKRSIPYNSYAHFSFDLTGIPDETYNEYFKDSCGFKPADEEILKHKYYILEVLFVIENKFKVERKEKIKCYFRRDNQRKDDQQDVKYLLYNKEINLLETNQ